VRSSPAAPASPVAGLDRLNALVNCAGIIRRGTGYDLGVFETVIAVNLTCTMRMCLACHPLLKRSGGAVVNMASMLSFFGAALLPAYSVSKGGVAQLTKALVARLCPFRAAREDARRIFIDQSDS
jgi:NAD(P)-dependent dehydrogenase (short-subunit alcohol dehydrogenase family)